MSVPNWEEVQSDLHWDTKWHTISAKTFHFCQVGMMWACVTELWYMWNSFCASSFMRLKCCCTICYKYIVPFQRSCTPPLMPVLHTWTGFCSPVRSCRIAGTELEVACTPCTIYKGHPRAHWLWGLSHVATGNSQMTLKSPFHAWPVHYGQWSQPGGCPQLKGQTWLCSSASG